MKGIVISIVALTLITLTVFFLGALATLSLREVEERLLSAEESGDAEKIKEAREIFERRELLLSLSVSDDAMTDIYTALYECERVASLGGEELSATINRLIAEIAKTRRLHGFSLFSVI